MNIPQALRSEENKLIFYTTEKSDCTEVVTLFFKHCHLYRRAIRYQKKTKRPLEWNWIQNYRWEQHVRHYPTTLSHLTSTEYKKFKFVRCPYERAISSYIVYIQKGNIGSFHGFLQYLKNHNIIRYQSKLDPHYITQSFQEENQFKWDGIIHIETMQQDLDAHRHICLLPNKDHTYTSPHWNKNKKANSIGDQAHKININIPELHYPDLYNRQTKELVEELFKIDLENHPRYTYDYFIERFSSIYYMIEQYEKTGTIRLR